MKRVNIFISLALFAFGGYYSLLITRLPKRNMQNTLSSAFMPWLLVVLLFGLAALLLVLSLARGSREDCEYRISRREGTGLIALVGLVLVYLLALPLAGFLPLTPPLLAVLIFLTGSRSWKEIVLGAIASTAAIWVFFTLLFRVQLPQCPYLPFV